MIDKQPVSTGPQARVPFVSAFLHWMAMPAIVFLRSGFGFSFLSPKSIFLSFSFAVLPCFFIAYHEPVIWSAGWAFASFALGAVVLYLLHLWHAFGREARRKGEHDYFAGTSHLLRFPGIEKGAEAGGLENLIYGFIEPGIVLIVALGLRVAASEKILSAWLMLVVPAMCLKAFLNYWYPLRHEKKEADLFGDAERKIKKQAGDGDLPLPSAGGRKKRVPRPSNAGSDKGQEAEEERFAEILRLLPPSSLAQAETNYRALSKEAHPDANHGSDVSGQRMARLNEAIEYFRKRESGV